MTLSELIKKLQELQEQYGPDIKVAIYSEPDGNICNYPGPDVIISNGREAAYLNIKPTEKFVAIS